MPKLTGKHGDLYQWNSLQLTSSIVKVLGTDGKMRYIPMEDWLAVTAEIKKEVLKDKLEKQNYFETLGLGTRHEVI